MLQIFKHNVLVRLFSVVLDNYNNKYIISNTKLNSQENYDIILFRQLSNYAYM